MLYYGQSRKARGVDNENFRLDVDNAAEAIRNGANVNAAIEEDGISNITPLLYAIDHTSVFDINERDKMNIDALLDKMIQPVIFPQDTINEWINQWQGKQIFPEAVSINLPKTLELFRKSSDPAEKEKLTLQMFQAKFQEIVKMVQKEPMQHFPQDEHIFAGCYGFWRVLEVFDPENDINFDQFCLLHIKKFMRSIGYNYYVGKLKHKLEKDTNSKVCFCFDGRRTVTGAMLYFPDKEDEWEGKEAAYCPVDPEPDLAKYPDVIQRIFREEGIENFDRGYLKSRVYGSDKVQILTEMIKMSAILQFGWKLVPLPVCEEDIIWEEYQQNKKEEK